MYMAPSLSREKHWLAGSPFLGITLSSIIGYHSILDNSGKDKSTSNDLSMSKVKPASELFNQQKIVFSLDLAPSCW